MLLQLLITPQATGEPQVGECTQLDAEDNIIQVGTDTNGGKRLIALSNHNQCITHHFFSQLQRCSVCLGTLIVQLVCSRQLATTIQGVKTAL
jgi:hypothetical protein